MPRRVLVTGASGNVGTALLRRLATEVDPPEIIGVVRRPPTTPAPDTVPVAWHQLDLADPHAAEHLAPLMRTVDAVVHLAWGFQPTRDESYLRRTGVGGTAAVLEAARHAGVDHLVHMSSVGAYSPAGTAPRSPRITPTKACPPRSTAATRPPQKLSSTPPRPTAVVVR